MIKQFAPVDRTEKVELTKGDVINLTALLASGADAIGFILENQPGNHTSGAGERLQNGCLGYMVKLFGLLGVERHEINDYMAFLAADELKRMQEAGVDVSQMVGASGHPRDAMH